MMTILTALFIWIVALEHFYILYLEMFALDTHRAKRIFRLSDEAAKNRQIQTLFANQGLYNGFLATGLLLAYFAQQPLFILFFLICVIVAAVYGAMTANKGILIKQGLPAIVALVFYIMA